MPQSVMIHPRFFLRIFMANDYIPVIILMSLGFLIGTAMARISYMLGPRLKRAVKLDTYECGMPPYQDARNQFSIKYYVIAVLFLVFDIEGVYLIPFSTIYREIVRLGFGKIIFLELLVFMVLLIAGFVYVYKAKSLEWNNTDEG